jgi:hypothetical protein
VKNVASKPLVLEDYSPVYNRKEIPDLSLLCAFHERMCYTTYFLPLYVIDKGKGKGKSKEIPLQFWTGIEDSRNLRSQDFMRVGTQI